MRDGLNGIPSCDRFCSSAKQLLTPVAQLLRENKTRGIEVRSNMSEKAAALLKEALALPVEERAELATSLIDSLEPAVDIEVETAWQQEIARRLNDISAGKARMIPWEEVRSRARAMLNEKAG